MMKALWNKVKDWPLAVWRWVFAPYSTWSRRRKLGVLVVGLIVLLVLVDQLARWFPIPRALLGPVLEPLFYLDAKDAPAWKDRVAAFGLGFSALVGFALWHWRDVNARATIENARKDVNLKEFQEIQLRAAGALDRDKLGEEACEQLQIAALHQLRGFLRGEYGEAFKRPAFELLLAGHAAAMERIGLREKVEWWKESVGGNGEALRRSLREIFAEMRGNLSAVERERLGILRDEKEAIVGSGFPLKGRVLDLVDWHGVKLENKDLSEVSLMGANLCEVSGHGATLTMARLQGAYLVGAQLAGAAFECTRLDGACFGGARLEGADLSGALLEMADLTQAQLARANLREARLTGAYLFETNLDGANLEDAEFDDATELQMFWRQVTEEQREAARERLRALGAVHVRDVGEG
jgi:uncharacterized protein YjbI with pentapeptide repeats